MNQKSFQSDLEKKRSSIEVELSPSELFALTLNKSEIKKLGLCKGNLLPVLKEVSHLRDGQLTLEDVLGMKVVPKIRNDFCISVDDMIIMLRDAGRKELSAKIVQKPPKFISRAYLKNHLFGSDDFSSLVYSYLVLSKIKLSRKNLEKIGVDEKILNICERRTITIIFHKYTKDLDCRRAEKCPFTEKCSSFFTRLSGRRYTSYSCSDCLIYKVESHLKNEGHFSQIEIPSYGVAPIGYVG